MKLAICGATGLVGQTLLNLLASEDWLEHDVVAYSSERTAGQRVKRGTRSIDLEPLPETPPSGIDFAFFALPSALAREYAPRWTKAGVRIVDKSSAFRLDSDVPLVVPEVNSEMITGDVRLIATPNCTTIPVAVALEPLRRRWELIDVRVSSYQAVSGAGSAGIEDWEAEEQGRVREQSCFPHRIHRNVIPLIGKIGEDGIALEERKLMDELPKILGRDDLSVASTSVRVPVHTGHAMAVEAGFRGDISLQDILSTLRDGKGLVLHEDPSSPPTPLDAAGRDEVLVGRVRLAPKELRGNGITSVLLWVVGDNLRKGAALNGLQIVDRWMKV